jgi:2-oxoglutarate ferredoxin oxidoreductase subunit beta
MTTSTQDLQTLTRKDFVSDQEVRWCPGCGDYAILAQMQKVLPDLGIPKEDIVFISGIGCSSRFPYYMNTFGIHSIHGRAPTLATGLAIANPKLSIWVITGDGDGLSIGGNHLLHACRRNVNLNIILFNNRIYGLTKGQYSPTSRTGHITKSSPMGSIDRPIEPLALALSAEATFVARTMDSNVKHLAETLARAAAHNGTSFVEVYQNCVIFNPDEWTELSSRNSRDENMVFLEHGMPLVFGKSDDKGITLRDGFEPEVIELGNGASRDDLLVHNAESIQLAFLLSRLEKPVPMGVFREVQRPSYGENLLGQVAEAKAMKGSGNLNSLYRSADLWQVKPTAVEAKVSGELPLDLDEEYVDEIDREIAEPDRVADEMGHTPIKTLNPKAPISVEPLASVANAIRWMRSHNIGCVLVTGKNGQLEGILTERDVLTRVACQVEDLSKAAVVDFMTPDPYALKAEAPITHAMHLMSANGFRHLPLVDDEFRPEGIISFRDVARYFSKKIF